MFLYVHADHSPAYDADLDRVGLRCDVRVMDLGPDSPFGARDAVHAVTRPGIRGLIVPDDIARHTHVIEVVKQCARLLGISSNGVGRYLHDIEQTSTVRAEAPGSAAFAPRQLPGVLTATH